MCFLSWCAGEVRIPSTGPTWMGSNYRGLTRQFPYQRMSLPNESKQVPVTNCTLILGEASGHFGVIFWSFSGSFFGPLFGHFLDHFWVPFWGWWPWCDFYCWPWCDFYCWPWCDFYCWPWCYFYCWPWCDFYCWPYIRSYKALQGYKALQSLIRPYKACIRPYEDFIRPYKALFLLLALVWLLLPGGLAL